jgi:hypothetical protein
MQSIYGCGMSMRDWFAGQALAGLLGGPQGGGAPNIERIVMSAYAIADAMLAERERKP